MESQVKNCASCRHKSGTGCSRVANGEPRCSPFEPGYPYWEAKDQPQPSKTLLDEFAMAAMAAIVRKRPYMTASNEREMETALMIIRSDVRGAYEIASAMMKERARRDEMGNVKEVEK